MADATNATNKKRTTRYTDDEMCKALTSFNGMVYLAAKHLGCAPSAIYRRMEKSARVREVVDNSRGELLDVAETALKAAVTAKEGWAVCFTLKTIGKNRGYVERNEWSGPNGGPVQTQNTNLNINAPLDLSDKSDLQLQQMMRSFASALTPPKNLNEQLPTDADQADGN